jgi:adenosylmethionine-8-amino-7-oxononanoate aminotransferase
VYVFDRDGQRYLDGCSGAVVANIGHGVPDVLQAIRRQSEQCTFAYRTQFTNAPARRLERRLADLAPGDLDAVTLVNSGSEANEAAMRMALRFWAARGRPDKHMIVARRTSYHGMTLGALSASGHPDRRVDLEAALIPGLQAASPYRCPAGDGPERARCVEVAIDQLGADRVAAVIAEPVVGAAGGALTAPEGYWAELRRVCDRHDVLLIADEVMTGLGRTGVWFASAREDVVADLVTVGKGMSAGYAPMAALIARRPVADVVEAAGGVFGHTYSANPVGAAACLAVLDYVERHDLLSKATDRGAVLRAGLDKLAMHHRCVTDVRGQGLLLGLELGDHKHARRFPKELGVGQQLVDAAFRRGLLLYPAGTDESPDAVLVTPPLVIQPEEIAELLHLLDGALSDFEQIDDIHNAMGD